MGRSAVALQGGLTGRLWRCVRADRDLWRASASLGLAMSEQQVWLETNDGQPRPIGPSCSMGRATGNDVVIDDQRVSRRHALIHKQDNAEYWVIDLGSGNGTYLNGRRVTLATRLKDRDILTVGGLSFAFRQVSLSPSHGRKNEPSTAAQTIIDIRTVPCWLLVADIKGSTALATTLPTTELAMLVGRWMSVCKEIIETQNGTINKYLGDGFLAYWHFDQRRSDRLLGAVDQLLAMQKAAEAPHFRVALHLGPVAIGGGASAGEDSLSGLDVTIAFRMEKIAGSIGCDFLASESAKPLLETRRSLRDVGVHPIAGLPQSKSHFYEVS
jgi:adenylate cyclase